MAVIGPSARLVLVNTYVPKPWQDPDNQVIATAAGPTRTSSWSTGTPPSPAVPACSDPDEVHPQPPGARLVARLVVAERQAGRDRHRLVLQPARSRAAGSAWPGLVRRGRARVRTAPGQGPQQAAALSYEQARDELTELVKRLEAGGLTLEQSLELWERGEHLAAICDERLEGARARLAAVMAQRTEIMGIPPRPSNPDRVRPAARGDRRVPRRHLSLVAAV